MKHLVLDVNAFYWLLTRKQLGNCMAVFFHIVNACETSAHGLCTLNLEQLSRLAGISKSSASRAITRLADEGMIHRSARAIQLAPLDHALVQAYINDMARSGWEVLTSPCVDVEGVRWNQAWQADDVCEVYVPFGSRLDARTVSSFGPRVDVAPHARAIEASLRSFTSISKNREIARVDLAGDRSIADDSSHVYKFEPDQALKDHRRGAETCSDRTCADLFLVDDLNEQGCDPLSGDPTSLLNRVIDQEQEKYTRPVGTCISDDPIAQIGSDQQAHHVAITQIGSDRDHRRGAKTCTDRTCAGLFLVDDQDGQDGRSLCGDPTSLLNRAQDQEQEKYTRPVGTCISDDPNDPIRSDRSTAIGRCKNGTFFDLISAYKLCVFQERCKNGTFCSYYREEVVVIPTRAREGAHASEQARERGDQPRQGESGSPIWTAKEKRPARRDVRELSDHTQPETRPSERQLRQEARMGEAPLESYRKRHRDAQGRFDVLYELEHVCAQIGLEHGLELQAMRRAPFGDDRKLKLMERVTAIGGPDAAKRFLEWAMYKALEEPDWLEQMSWNGADLYLIYCKAALKSYLAISEHTERIALEVKRRQASAPRPSPEQEKTPPRPMPPLAPPATQALAAQPRTLESYRGGPFEALPLELLRLDDAEFIAFFKRPEFLRLPEDPHQGNFLFGWLVRPEPERPIGFLNWAYYMIDMRRRYAAMIALDHTESRATRCGCPACYWYRSHAREADRLLKLPVSWRLQEAIDRTAFEPPDDLFGPDHYLERGIDPETRHYTLEDRRLMEEAAKAWQDGRAVRWQIARLNRPPC
jgi:hypothetical protein